MTEIKTIGGLRRRDGSTREALYERWQQRHAPYVTKHAAPEHYRITLLEGRADGSESPYDGLAELWFRDDAHRQGWVGEGSPRGGDGFNDALEPGAGFALVTTEHVIVDGEVPPDAHKIVYLIRRRADVGHAEFLKHWREVHAPNVAGGVERTEGCLRYAISLSGDPDSVYHGAAEMWWSDSAARQGGLLGVEPDGFGDLIEAMELLVGREIVITP